MKKPPDATTSPFLFTVCQAGAEPVLKAELARIHPSLRPAFSRPGFVTFKQADPKAGAFNESFELGSVFARAYGLSIGKADSKTCPALGDRVRKVLDTARSLGGGLRLHVFERDRFAPGEEPKDHVPGEWARAVRTALAEALSPSEGLFLPDSPAEPGDRVLDVVVVEPDEWWLGIHEHSDAHSPYPGGNPEIELPPEAPSRAYLKLEEAVLWSKAPLRKGDTAIEIGAAPGGASYALLQRGLRVFGVDPGAMDAVVLENSRFTYVRALAGDVRREELPRVAQWILLDMNTKPELALPEAERFAHEYMNSLFGMILTLKLNEWEMAARIPRWLARLRKLGMVRVGATQLVHNRQEICVFGLTPKGAVRRP